MGPGHNLSCLGRRQETRKRNYMSFGTIVLSAFSALLFGAILLAFLWAIRRLKDWSLRVDEERERKLQALRDADRLERP